MSSKDLLNEIQNKLNQLTLSLEKSEKENAKILEKLEKSEKENAKILEKSEKDKAKLLSLTTIIFQMRSIIPLVNYKNNITMIDNIISQGEYNKLLSYGKFDLEFLRGRLHLLRRKNKVLIHIVDNFIDLEQENDNKWRIIHYFIWIKVHLSVVKYLVEKKVNLQAKTINGNSPFHMACEDGTYNMVDYLIDKTPPPYEENTFGAKPMAKLEANSNIDRDQKCILMKKLTIKL